MHTIIIAFTVIALLASGGGKSAENATEPERIEVVEEHQEVEEVTDEALPMIEVELSSLPNTTSATDLLLSLKEAEEKIPVAVYSIEDKTGQYTDLGSTVVSQGATEMLITALMRSRQFTVLDRAKMQNVISEQNLQTNNRLATGSSPLIGLLTGARYIIEGAVTEYQVDKDTGGFGLVIGGKGGTTQYARASCAIDLRITDTSTGEVVWAESLKKEIVGKKISLTLFSFLGTNLVELETGQGKQQVINLVIRTLLEEAVYQIATDVELPDTVAEQAVLR